MKKVWAILLGLMLTTTALAGCGSDNQPASGTETGNSETGSSAAEGSTEEPYEIVVELIGSGIAQPDTAIVEEAINELTVPAINCTVKFREISIADHATQLGLLGSDGDRMDIIFSGYTTTVSNLHANGLLVGLGDMLEEYGADILEKSGHLMDACYIDDDYYCVPGNYYPAVQTAISYDKQIFEEYNIQIPENPENSYEYLDALFAAVKESGFPNYCTTGGDGSSVSLTGHISDAFGATLGSVGVYGILLDATEDTEIVNKFALPEYREACHKLREWWEKGYLVPDSLTSGSTLVGDQMAGKVACGIASMDASYLINNIKNTGREQGAIEFGDYYISGTSIPEYSMAVTVTSEQPEKAVQLLNMIAADTDLANLFNYGIEGTHYVKTSDHIIDFPEGVDFSNTGYGIQIVTFGDKSQIFQRTPVTEEWYDTLEDYGPENAQYSKAFGYVFDSSSVKTQVAAISAVVGEYQPTLACGLIEEDQIDARLDEFIAALESAGINEVIAENQRQFDAWLEANG